MKQTKKGRENEYWHAAWMAQGKTRNVHLGICRKVSREEAPEKASAKKTEKLRLEE